MYNNGHTMKQLLISIAASVVLAGCASTGTDRLARDTAQTIEGITADQVTISNVQREDNAVKWVATTPVGVYDCEADQAVGFVTAVKRE